MSEKQNPHIAIVGSGAVGSLLGGMLARNGENVTLIGKKAHIQTIKKKGLTINGVGGDFTILTDSSEELDFRPDILIVAVKTQDVEKTCKQIRPYVDNIPIVMIQNGIVSSEIAGSIFGKENIVGCTILYNVQFQEPGVVSYINKKPCVIGRAFGKNEHWIKQIQTLLGLVSKTVISENILGVQWSKLFINAIGNALDGMTGLSLGEYIRYRDMRRIGVLLLKEALELVTLADVKLEPLPGIPLTIFKFMISLPTPFASWLLKYAMSNRGNDDIVTSTLQSLRKGKTTEIDYLNGEFVRLGEKIGHAAPYNKRVVGLIHEIERTGKFYTPEELRKEFSV